MPSPLSPWAKIGRAGLITLALGFIAAQMAVFTGASWALDNRQKLSDRLTAWQFEPDDTLQVIIDGAGLSLEGSMYFSASLPEVVPAFEFDRFCTTREPGIGVLGCYRVTEKRIYLYEVTDERLVSILPVVAAHEMLHASWFRFDQDTRDELAVLLEENFAKLPDDHRLRERIKQYEDNDPSSRIPELYAILGTEISPLTEELDDHYRRFFDDREQVVVAADRVYAVFDTIVEELESLVAELEERSTIIDERRSDYEARSQDFQDDLAVYNDRVSRYNAGENVSGAADFPRQREELIARRDSLRAEREEIQTLIDLYNALYDEVQLLNQELTELNQGINITSVAPQDTITPDSDSVNGGTSQ
jgi:hypothetical protein